MVDYLAWFKAGTTGKKAFDAGIQVYLAAKEMGIGIGLMRLKEDYFIQDSEILFKDRCAWKTGNIQLRAGQYCLYYRASFGEQRDMEKILKDILPYLFTLLWENDELLEELLESALVEGGSLRPDLAEDTEPTKKALEIARQLAQKLNLPEDRQDLRDNYYEIAGSLLSQGELEGALKLYQETLEIDEQLVQELGTPEARQNLRNSYEKVGDMLLVQGELYGALEMYQQAMAIDEQLAQELGTPEALRDLCDSYGVVAFALRETDELDAALPLLRKAVEIRKHLALEMDTAIADPDFCWSLMEDCVQIGEILQEQDDMKGVKEIYQWWLDFFLQFSQRPAAPDVRIELSSAYQAVGEVEQREGNMAEAMKLFQKALEIDEQRARETGVQLNFKTYEGLCELLQEDGYPKEARELRQKLREAKKRLKGKGNKGAAL